MKDVFIILNVLEKDGQRLHDTQTVMHFSKYWLQKYVKYLTHIFIIYSVDTVPVHMNTLYTANHLSTVLNEALIFLI